MSLMLFLATIMATEQQPSRAADTVFACQYFHTDREASDGSVHVVDLRAVRHADKTWTLEWANKSAVVAKSFPANFGSIGGSVGLEWQDAKGNPQKAFLAFGDVIDGSGKEYFWLNLKRPSLWQTPGYGCESQSGASK